MSQPPADTVPLAETAQPFAPPSDFRQTMPEPLPVRLITVNDARMPCAAGLEAQLDGFYLELLGFEREACETAIVYRAENFRLILDVREPPVSREDLRPLGIEVLNLNEAEQKLGAANIEYVRQKALHPGQESLLLRDPSGNWLELSASALLR